MVMTLLSNTLCYTILEAVIKSEVEQEIGNKLYTIKYFNVYTLGAVLFHGGFLADKIWRLLQYFKIFFGGQIFGVY